MSVLLPLGLVLLVVLAFWKVVDEEREAPPATPPTRPTGPWDAYGVPGDEHGYDIARAWELRVEEAAGRADLALISYVEPPECGRGSSFWACRWPRCDCSPPEPPAVEVDEDDLMLRSVRPGWAAEELRRTPPLPPVLTPRDFG